MNPPFSPDVFPLTIGENAFKGNRLRNVTLPYRTEYVNNSPAPIIGKNSFDANVFVTIDPINKTKDRDQPTKSFVDTI